MSGNINSPARESRAQSFRTIAVLALFVLAAGGSFAQLSMSPQMPVPLYFTATLQGLGGNCLDVLDANPQPGAHVDNFTCNGTPAQVFHINFNGTITNFAGQCLDVLYGNANAGILDFTNCNGTAAQQWHQKGQQFIGLSGKCLDVLNGNSGPGAAVDLANCNGTAAQNWQIINAPTVIEGVGSKCLDIINSNTSPGARVQIFECNRGPNAQIFTLTAVGEIRNATGECLEVMYANTAAGQVQMWTCNGTPAQKWQRQGRALVSGLSSFLGQYCLGTVNSFNSGAQPLQQGLDHTPVGLVPCNGTEAQQWITADLYTGGLATLLIVTSDAFSSTFDDFVNHKISIGILPKLLTMSQVCSSYPAADDALSLKYAIEDHYRNYGTKYVLLGGDASQVPVRWRSVLDGSGKTYSFVVSDLYYQNLYSGHQPFTGFHNGFDNWDSNGNGLFDEESWNSPLQNPDNVDGFPDIVVGRIPAYNTTVLAAALNKIINYENQTSFPATNRFAWVADACYGGAYNYVQSLSKGTSGSSFAEEINLANSCNAPTSGFFDDNGWSVFQAFVNASDYEWITYIGHGGPSAWGYGSTWNNSMTNALTNQSLPVVTAIACQTTQWENWILLAPLSERPSVYDTNASSSSSVNIGANWLFNARGGAIAYIGENVVMEDDAGTTFTAYMYAQHNNGFVRLGDMYRMAQQEYFDYNFTNPGFDNHFSAPRIYLGIMNLIGDPSMRTF